MLPDPYNQYGDNRLATGGLDNTPIMGGAVLLCNRAAAHATLGQGCTDVPANAHTRTHGHTHHTLPGPAARSLGSLT